VVIKAFLVQWLERFTSSFVFYEEVTRSIRVEGSGEGTRISSTLFGTVAVIRAGDREVDGRRNHSDARVCLLSSEG